MHFFYEEIAAGKAKDEALRTAKLRYLEESDQLGSHPAYWAAFTPIGDMRPISIDDSGKKWWWLVICGLGLLLGIGVAMRKLVPAHFENTSTVG